ncbi:hypothetical protein EGW08_015283 [Elysia chlorotica]|uniref:DUF4774 domain-containing protein n=1 Tax=Elysia chlorotica TaxID=188477 RepID=A0A3S1B619_ELYCH|nr:hypothetical protein EGW08_015283 [Elysia chlorotica]
MSRFVLLAVVLALTITLSYQAPLAPQTAFAGSSLIIPKFPPPVGPNRPLGPSFPKGPFPGGPFPGGPIVVSKRSGDSKVDVEVNTGPKGTSGTVSGTHTTSGGTTIKGSISHGPGGTSGGVKVSVPIQG